MERIFPEGPGEIDMKIVPTGKAGAVAVMRTVPVATVVGADVLRVAMTTSPMAAIPVGMRKIGTEALKQLTGLTTTKAQAVPMECIQARERQNLLPSPVLMIPRKAMAGSGKLLAIAENPPVFQKTGGFSIRWRIFYKPYNIRNTFYLV
jgi:hypothetical protein